jgi:hypothetical protein
LKNTDLGFQITHQMTLSHQMSIQTFDVFKSEQKVSVIITCPIYFHYFCALKILYYDYSFESVDSI